MLTWRGHLLAYLLTALVMVYLSYRLPAWLPGDFVTAMYADSHVLMGAEQEAALKRQEQDQHEKEQAQRQTVQTMERTRELAKQQGAARVGRAEAGVLGNSVLAELSANVLDASYDIGIIRMNRENEQARNKISSGFIDLNKKTQKENAAADTPGGLSVGLALGSSALSGYMSGLSTDKSLEG